MAVFQARVAIGSANPRNSRHRRIRMKHKPLSVRSFRLRNFKAVRDSGVVKFTPLTVLIGNNGSGKSSLIEGLETFQITATKGLTEAIERWRGFEFIWNRAVPHKPKEFPTLDGKTTSYLSNLMRFTLRSQWIPLMDISVSASEDMDSVFICREETEILERRLGDNVSVPHVTVARDTSPEAFITMGEQKFRKRVWQDDSSISNITFTELKDWQFFSLNAEIMGQPHPRNRNRPFQHSTLKKDGSNLADILYDFNQGSDFAKQRVQGIVETMRYILPYASDISPKLATELERTVHLQLHEGKFEVPGWLLSTGTLGALALIMALRQPFPPPLICIEEIENGLDPRTLNLLVDEIQRATQSGRTQVVCTTHSPYFLDLVPLSSIIVVERDATGQPTFTRPDEKALGDWAKEFAPGQLYTMSQLTRA